MRLALHRHLALEDMSTTMSTVGPGPEPGKGPSKEAAIHLSNLRRRKWSPFLSTLNRTSFRRSPARVCRTILLLVNFVHTPTWHGEQALWHLSLLHYRNQVIVHALARTRRRPLLSITARSGRTACQRALRHLLLQSRRITWLLPHRDGGHRLLNSHPTRHFRLLPLFLRAGLCGAGRPQTLLDPSP